MKVSSSYEWQRRTVATATAAAMAAAAAALIFLRAPIKSVRVKRWKLWVDKRQRAWDGVMRVSGRTDGRTDDDTLKQIGIIVESLLAVIASRQNDFKGSFSLYFLCCRPPSHWQNPRRHVYLRTIQWIWSGVRGTGMSWYWSTVERYTRSESLRMWHRINERKKDNGIKDLLLT